MNAVNAADNTEMLHAAYASDIWLAAAATFSFPKDPRLTADNFQIWVALV